MKQSKMSEIEREKGKPIVQVLTDLYARHDTQKAVANELGITQGTLSIWLIRLGLKQKTVLVRREEVA